VSGWEDMYVHRKPDLSATGSAMTEERVGEGMGWYGKDDGDAHTYI
jgi:hypothetical protein